MKKLLKRIMICFLVTSVIWFLFLLSDRKALNERLIRFHVVANSDCEQDQLIKQKIRDVVLSSMETDLQNIADTEEAKAYLFENLPKIQRLVDHTLSELGFHGGATVTLRKEAFEIRHYDTFSLPAGIYESLRIVIGDGLGQNWWCVTFPTLCIPATTPEFADTVVSSGFSYPLAQTLSGNDHYEIRFFLLNQLGKLEKYLFTE